MLQGMKTEVREVRGLQMAEDAEEAALITEMIVFQR